VESVAEPSPILRGERIFLRGPERNDIPTFVRWFNDADVVANLAMRAPLSDAAEHAWFDRMLEAQARSDYHFVICLLADRRPIGTVGFHRLDLHNGTAELGIAIGERAEWGKGYGRDAMLTLADFGFGELRLERIGLEVYSPNQRARRTYESVGFVHEATLRRARYQRGEYTDVHVMSLLRDEWARLPHPRAWSAR
jgi:RimJ/RimL family protein N-acetyltransferase